MARRLLFPLIVFGFVLVWQTKVGRRDLGREPFAIGALSAINAAQAGYAASAGRGGYAVSLEALTTPCPHSTMSGVSRDFLHGRGSGYRITLHADIGRPGPADCNGAATRTAYYVTAEPTGGPPLGGIRAFATDQNGDIWSDARGIAPKPPFAETAHVKRLQ